MRVQRRARVWKVNVRRSKKKGSAVNRSGSSWIEKSNVR
ncbi:Nuclear RNA export factor 3 [Labeo rohita]|uniref:Nuclear RNA export factor 3 n=1 Tax=Labeo rohita TaxID=84645 RepID=A0ABQ8MRW2_LABRO|nr:Nuclear RNA export factor 3 [Labeo rohita]